MKHMCLFPYDAAAVGGTPVTRSNNARANQACYSCRKQKRKCDKALPSCSLCTRMSRFCDYSETPPNPTVEDLTALKGRLAELESKLQDVTRHSSTSCASTSTSISPPAEAFFHDQCPPVFPQVETWARGLHDFDPTMFLDATLFREAGLPVTRPVVEIPQDVLQCLADTEQLQQSLTDYFTDVHPWFPVVRRKRLNIASPLWDNSPESTLLCLAMMLVAWQPTDGLLITRNFLYFSTKQLCAQLENAGVASLSYLQALLLIALYEYGHGIYPAAWMTVGHCVRYAEFIGLPSYKESNSMLGNCMTWVDAEERRRAWWAVYVLDKIICVGSDKRPLCGEPANNEILPVPDEAWDSGDASLAIQHTVTSSRLDPQPPFARLCQAALLVSKMLRHCQRIKLLKLQHKLPGNGEVASLTEGALELAACAQTEISAQPEKYFALVPALTLAYSAVFKIVMTHLHPSAAPPETAPAAAYEDADWAATTTGNNNNNTTPSTQLISYDSQKKAMTHMHDIVHDITAFISHKEGLAKISPFALDAIYTAGVTCACWRQQCGLKTIQKCLAGIRVRWAVTAQYEALLEQHDLAAVSSSSGFSMPLGTMPIVPTVPSTTMGL